MVPGLSHLHDTDRFAFEDQEIEQQILMRVVYRHITHPLCKYLRLENCNFRFLTASHGDSTCLCFFLNGSCWVRNIPLVVECLFGPASTWKNITMG